MGLRGRAAPEQPPVPSGAVPRELASNISPTGLGREGARPSRTLLDAPAACEPMDWRGLALVALGGALGAAARYGTSLAFASVTKAFPFPWATLAVNLLGSLLIGALLLDHGMEHAPRLFVVVGILGGFTTMSTYSFESVDLWRTSHVGMAVANVLANGVGGPLCALLGWKLAS